MNAIYLDDIAADMSLSITERFLDATKTMSSSI